MSLLGFTTDELGVPASALPLAPGEVGYDPGVLQDYLDVDAEFRASHPAVVGGPLRDAKGGIAPVPAYMRLDAYTNRDGPVPPHAPDLGPCWLWTRGTVKGYGYVRVGKRKVQAYRLNYERWVGPIPDGLLIDHLCRVRRCVRPSHLEPATYSENTTRSPIHPGMVRKAQEACLYGHDYTPENTYTDSTGARHCRACGAASKRRRTGAEPRRMATETHCAQGHPWEGNLKVSARGKRSCATCSRLAWIAWRDRKRGESLR